MAKGSWKRMCRNTKQAKQQQQLATAKTLFTKKQPDSFQPPPPPLGYQKTQIRTKPPHPIPYKTNPNSYQPLAWLFLYQKNLPQIQIQTQILPKPPPPPKTLPKLPGQNNPLPYQKKPILLQGC